MGYHHREFIFIRQVFALLAELNFHAHQLTRHVFFQPRHHIREQGEAFSLIFIERVTLTITTQMDHLTQVINGHNMFAPQTVQRLQQHGTFHLLHNIGGIFFALVAVEFINGGHHTLANFLVGNAFFFGPVINWKINRHNIAQAFAQARCVPLFSVSIFRNMF